MKQILAIAFGNRQTAAVLVESTSTGLSVVDFCLLEAPVAKPNERTLPAETYAEHFRQLRHALGGTRIKQAVVVLRHSDSLLQLTELPPMPVSTLRDVLQRNSKLYLKEEYHGHVFDCHVQQAPAKVDAAKPAGGEGGKPPPAAQAGKLKKISVLVGGARRALVDNLVKAGRLAGFRMLQVIPAQMALSQAMKTPFSGDLTTAVANFDIGLEHSSICILSNGEIVQSRLVPMGGRNLTAGLAEAMNVTVEAAESVKVLLPNTVDSKLELLLAPLAQELKASIDFFEAQSEQKISAVFISGGTARSPQILQLLEKQTHLPCRAWHVPDNASLSLSPERATAFKRDMPQFMAAMGAAMDCLEVIPRRLNLLATQLDEEQKRQRSPVRLTLAAAALLWALMLVWSAILGWRLLAENAAVKAYSNTVVQRRAAETRLFQKAAGTHQERFRLLSQQATNRFLAAPVLDALQRTVVDDVIVTRVSLQRTPMTVAKGGKKQEREAMVVTIQAKDYSELGATEEFIDALANNPYFKARLPSAESVTLKQRSSRQADTANPTYSFALVTIECLLIE